MNTHSNSDIDRDVSLSISKFGALADDIIINILILKIRDHQSSFLPFLLAHSLELSAKAAAYNLGLSKEIRKANHNVALICSEIEKKRPNIRKLLPTEEHLKEYKNLYFPGEKGKHQYTIDHLPTNIEQLELAYIYDNVKNLKYGLDKDLRHISIVEISFAPLNIHFFNLFKFIRDLYSNIILNERLQERFERTLKDHNSISQILHFLVTPDLLISHG